MFLLGTSVLIFVYMQMRRAFRAVKSPGEETGQEVLDKQPAVDASLNPTTEPAERQAFNQSYQTWKAAEKAKEQARSSPLNRVTRAQTDKRGKVSAAVMPPSYSGGRQYAVHPAYSGGGGWSAAVMPHSKSKTKQQR